MFLNNNLMRHKKKKIRCAYMKSECNTSRRIEEKILNIYKLLITI